MKAAKNPGGITDISPAVADPGMQCHNIPRIPAGMPEDSASPGISGPSAIPAGIERTSSSDAPGCIRVADDPALISPIPPGSPTPDSIYTPLELAAQELRARWNDSSLRYAVEESLNGALPHFFRDAPRALHWPTVASPNIWMHEFHSAAQSKRLAPLVFEYRRDKFHPGNETKRHLLRWRFWQGLDIHGRPRTKCLPTADMNQASGRPFTEVRTSNGAKLVDLHASLLRDQFPETEAHDMSDWIESWPGMAAFYDAYMSLCICHCLLIESFRTEGSDRMLTEQVFMPAFERAARKFGVQPLIVALEPVDGPIDLYWYSYPVEIEPLARQALNGGSGHV